MLQKWYPKEDPHQFACKACGGVETARHIFLDCSEARLVWTYVFQWYELYHLGWKVDWDDWCWPELLAATPPMLVFASEDGVRAWCTVWGEVLFGVWLARNGRTFVLPGIHVQSTLAFVKDRLLAVEHSKGSPLSIEFANSCVSLASFLAAKKGEHISSSASLPLQAGTSNK